VSDTGTEAVTFVGEEHADVEDPEAGVAVTE
jgi:hypothetical protein